MSIPKLRFPDFAGKWEEKPLGDVATFSKGKGISKADISPKGATPCIRYGELYTHYGTRIDEVLSATDVPVSELKLSQGGEVIVPASGEDAKDIATAAVVLQRGVALGGDLNIIRSACDGFFLASYIAGKKRLTLAAMAQGNSVVHLYPAQLGSLILSFPALPEQQKIAAFLGVVDAKLVALAAKRAALGRFKAGLMQKLFSQQLRFTRDDVQACPDWQKKELRAVSTINPKSPNLPKRFRYIDLESVSAGTLGAVREIDATEAPSRAQRVLQHGDIIYQMVRPYQRNNLYFDLDGVYVGSTGYAQIRAKQNRHYLFQVLHTDEFVNRVLELCTGTGYPAINSNDLGKATIPLPHPDEQQKIADALSAMDAKIQAVADQVSKLAAFKKGLLQQMFV
jgi:type I restriction enzyme S subunit